MAVNIQKYKLQMVKEKGGRYNLDKIINSPEKAKDVFIEVLDLDIQAEEVVCLVTVDTKNKVTGAFEVSRGSLCSSLLNVREVFKRAMLANAAAILIAHNHPSGNPEPSTEDIKITKRLKEAGDLLGIQLLDHIIIGEGSKYASLKQDSYKWDYEDIF